MNKLKLFVLVIICGAVFSTDCPKLLYPSDCIANSSCQFNQLGSTCKNLCEGLDQKHCQNNTNSQLCDYFNATCGVFIDCNGLVSDKTQCNNNTSCSFKDPANSTCKFNGSVLSDFCKTENDDEPTCTKSNQCIYTDPKFACTYTTGLCKKFTTIGQCTATANANYCSWDTTDPENPVCLDLTQTAGDKQCTKLTSHSTCIAVSFCADTTPLGTCTPITNYCSINNNDKTKCDTATSDTQTQANCKWADAQPAACTNKFIQTCSVITTNTDCDKNTNCKWVQPYCANKTTTACTPDMTKDLCDAKGKNCSLTLVGTCAIKTTKSTILAITLPLIALIIAIL